MPKRNTKTKHRVVHSRPERWNEQHRLICHLLEEELSGLLHYLRSLQYVSMFVLSAATITLVICLRALFENGQHAVTSYLVVIGSTVISITIVLLSLRPWVLPRFLLPLDLRQLRYDEMIDVISKPREYIHLLKQHIQHLTENYLMRKLGHLRRAIAVFMFGLAVAAVLSVALP